MHKEWRNSPLKCWCSLLTYTANMWALPGRLATNGDPAWVETPGQYGLWVMQDVVACAGVSYTHTELSILLTIVGSYHEFLKDAEEEMEAYVEY